MLRDERQDEKQSSSQQPIQAETLGLNQFIIDASRTILAALSGREFAQLEWSIPISFSGEKPSM